MDIVCETYGVMLLFIIYCSDETFETRHMKWKCVIGKPAGSKKDQVLFEDYHLCRVEGKDYSELRAKKCHGTYEKSFPNHYKVVVPSITMPKSPVTEELYLIYGRDNPGTLGLQVREPKPLKPSRLNPRPANSKQQRINSSPARMMTDQQKMMPEKKSDGGGNALKMQGEISDGAGKQGLNSDSKANFENKEKTVESAAPESLKRTLDCRKKASVIVSAFPQITKFNDFRQLSDDVKQLEIEGCVVRGSCDGVKVHTFPGCTFEVVEKGQVIETLVLPYSKY